ncbi:28874_t:CDS:2, partial [Gigaspora margarita]
KAAVEFLKKDYSKCLETCKTAMKYDTENKHTSEIQGQMRKCQEAMYQDSPESMEDTIRKAASDPEIMAYPVMQQILQQCQDDPRAFKEHLKNPTVAANIEKLMNAGILRTS